MASKSLEFYQNITNNENEHSNRKGSAFWNEGKWENFIAPFLPEDCSDMAFIEIGCNNGLFLKLAKEKGFRNVIGIEADKKAVKRGIEYRDSLGMDYKILNRRVGENFSFEELPVADFILISNVHYYFDLEDWFKLLDQMIHKTRYCLIISRPVEPNHHWKPRTDITGIKWYFRHWKSQGAIYGLKSHHKAKRDPSPRVLWSFLFESELKRVQIDDLIKGADGDNIKLERDSFIEELKKGIKLEDTKYYQIWRKRMSRRWDEKRTKEFVQKKIDLINDMRENGMKEPILVQLNNKLIDGGHRTAILRDLGYKSIITRPI
jgi:hypothetical protein